MRRPCISVTLNIMACKRYRIIHYKSGRTKANRNSSNHEIIETNNVKALAFVHANRFIFALEKEFNV